MTESMRPRVYGADHDDPDPWPKAGRTYATLHGGPLDGLLVDVTDCPPAELAEGGALITEVGAYGPGGRAVYGPADPTALLAWHWEGDTP
ncbi:hypothetical protein [Streptomyces roseolilacinus]|uniref:hypothetical protein n=1 Tax=Streptomyces roseolilacinus TaxID=66904 RepID=UPI0037FFA310